MADFLFRFCVLYLFFMSVQFAILRHGKKISSFGELATIAAHNDRTRETPNADRERGHLNVRAVGTGDLEADVRGVLALHGVDPAKARDDQVLARELLYTVSPGALRADPERADSALDADRVERFKELSWSFIEAKWSDRIAGAWWHADETTPHWQVVVVPVVAGQSDEEAERERAQRQRELDLAAAADGSKPKRARKRKKPSRLCAKDLWGSPELLRRDQSEFAAAMKSLGVERGVQGSRRTHQELKRFYGDLGAIEANQRVRAVGANLVMRGEIVAQQAPDSSWDLAPGPVLVGARDQAAAAARWSKIERVLRPAWSDVLAFARAFSSKVEAAVDAHTRRFDRLVALVRDRLTVAERNALDGQRAAVVRTSPSDLAADERRRQDLTYRNWPARARQVQAPAPDRLDPQRER